MHPAVKMLIGLIILAAGVYWYLPGKLPLPTLSSLVTVFAGVFGLFLIFIGLIVTWIEYEDLKWERKEKQEKAK